MTILRKISVDEVRRDELIEPAAVSLLEETLKFPRLSARRWIFPLRPSASAAASGLGAAGRPRRPGCAPTVGPLGPVSGLANGARQSLPVRARAVRLAPPPSGAILRLA